MAGETPVTIVGNLVDRIELSYTPAKVAIARFTIASTQRTYDRQSGQWVDGDTLYLLCTAWRDMAEHAAESLVKGTRVIASGRLRQSRWEAQGGEKRSVIGLEVDEIGPSLRFAAATVRKTPRTRSEQS